ncbi:alpha/beta fold hydrolase [Labedella endophytica]|uniref:Alpha/beta hydrolase n=1 Tax=Labedella endophytica TaxID=1523160 RepID=A0A433JRP7_9MICO|nr:alpha/beta hydrolase [Labedella endophytica]RUR01023.1 alpha/beta hydrolase [Labedella endophytica]
MPSLAPTVTLPGATHHSLDVAGVELHYVSAGSTGSPILLVHGWPETWWAFRQVIPLLARTHRVYTVDLRGFGDSSTDARNDYSEQAFAEDLRALVEHLDVGPVHLLAQDISGGLAFTFAATHPGAVSSFIGVETTFAGFGLEMLADVNNGGSWHLGFLGSPGIPQLMLDGHERDLVEWAYGVMGTTPDGVTSADLDEFVRAYTGPDAWHGSAGLYRSLFTDDGRTKALAESSPLPMPVLAVDGPNFPFTANSLRQVSTGEPTSVRIENVGHLVAQEVPDELARVVLGFIEPIDAAAAAAS